MTEVYTDEEIARFRAQIRNGHRLAQRRFERPWWIKIWTRTFWVRQRVRLKVWRATGHHFLWNKRV